MDIKDFFKKFSKVTVVYYSDNKYVGVSGSYNLELLIKPKPFQPHVLKVGHFIGTNWKEAKLILDGNTVLEWHDY